LCPASDSRSQPELRIRRGLREENIVKIGNNLNSRLFRQVDEFSQPSDLKSLLKAGQAARSFFVFSRFDIRSLQNF
jgi:hypothetical protein